VLGPTIVRTGDRLLGSVNRRLASYGVPPWWMNSLEFASAVVCGVCLAQRMVPAGVLLLVIHGMFDYLDGGLRRAAVRGGRQFAPAPFLHTVADKLSDVFLYLSLAWGGWIGWWLGAAASVVTVAVSTVGWWGQRRRGKRREDCLFDRSDRILVLLVFFPCSLFVPAVATTFLMNLAVLGERIWSFFRAHRQLELMGGEGQPL
jgi:phosphatidylglycerophosphate synthase